jgi:hypothetical protein
VTSQSKIGNCPYCGSIDIEIASVERVAVHLLNAVLRAYEPHDYPDSRLTPDGLPDFPTLIGVIHDNGILSQRLIKRSLPENGATIQDVFFGGYHFVDLLEPVSKPVCRAFKRVAAGWSFSTTV